MNENEIMEATPEVIQEETSVAATKEDNALVAKSDDKNTLKEVGECVVVGVIIFAFVKVCDWVVTKIGNGIKAIKQKIKDKKEQKQAPAQGPVANVTPDANQEGTAQQ